MAQGVFVFLHRWAGLAMAAFLLVVGLTGSLLAFNTELERVFAPRLFAPEPAKHRLDLATLAEKAERLAGPKAQLFNVANTEPDQVVAYVEPAQDPVAKRPYALDFNELYLDPATGDELGRRKRGDLSQGLVNLMPFLYDLHWRLALGDPGQWILGIIALVWTLDCFIAFYLTLPPARAAFWRKWKTAWMIKRGAGVYRLNFDLHRAGGLWLWFTLFIFAWSSVMMDWRAAYEPLMKALFDYRSVSESFETLTKRGAANGVAMDWRAAQSVGERLMAEQATSHNFAIGAPLSLLRYADANVYIYEVRGSRDLFERSTKGGGTSIIFDAATGDLLDLSQPTGERPGNTVESWLYALHMARVFGLPYRVFVCVLGLAIAMLSGTGVYIWWKKSRARRFHARGGGARKAALG